MHQAPTLLIADVSLKLLPASPVMSRLHQRRRLAAPLPGLVVSCGCALEAAPADSLLADYDVLEVLGQGSTGVVRKGRRRADGRSVALKTVRTVDAELQATALREFEVLRGVEHPNIIRAFDFLASTDRAVVVLEFFQGAELDAVVRRQPVRRLPERVAQTLFRQLLEAVHFLHGRRIIHRDIKGSNMLVSDDLVELKLLDFNTAHRLADGGALTMTGTHAYAAPEVLCQDSPSELSDVWSAGLCLHLMLSGRLPHRCEQYPSFAEFAEAVASKPVVLEGRTCWQETSEESKSVLRQCLEVEKSRRPAAMTLLHREAWLSNPLSTVPVRKVRCESLANSCSSRSTSCGSGKSDSSKKRSSSLPSSPLSLRSAKDVWLSA